MADIDWGGQKITNLGAPVGNNDAARRAYVDARIAKPNHVPNGEFQIWQEGTTINSTTTPANNDDTYVSEHVVLLSDGNDVVDVSQETSAVPTGAPAAIKLDVETANLKFGIAFLLENKRAAKLASDTVSLSFQARNSGATIGAIRAGVASWTGTADSITSDLERVVGN